MLSDESNDRKRFWGEQIAIYGLGWSGWGLVAAMTGMLESTPMCPGLLGGALISCFPGMLWSQVAFMWPNLSLATRKNPD